MGTKIKNKTIEGFSERLQFLCELAGYPNKHGVIEKLATITRTNANTFKTWYRLDSPPLTTTMLDVVSKLLELVPGNYSPQLVSAWVYFGDSNDFPFPFGDKSFIADYCVQHLNIYEKIIKSTDVDKARITDKKKLLALKKILTASTSDDGITYSLSEDDTQFVKDILNL